MILNNIKMKQIVKYTLIAVFLYSCNTSKQMVTYHPVTIDMRTQDTISDKSISLEKGKICYVSGTSYDYVLPDMSIFKSKNSSDFITITPHTGLAGFASELYQTDTIIKSQYLTKTALETAAKKSLLGFEFIYFDVENYKNERSNIIESIGETYKPDFIISLDGLEFRISGNKKTSATVISSTYSEGDFTVTDTRPEFSNDGNILITYNAIWIIKYLNDNKQTKINQKGQVYSTYYKNYNLIEQLLQAARQAGNDFVSLLTSKDEK